MKQETLRCYIPLLLALLLLCACAPAARTTAAVAPPAVMPQQVPPVPEYRIQAGDMLEVRFYYNEELNDEVTVRPDGRITLQLAHDVMAAGLTPAELTRSLTERYATELNQPEISVTVRTFGGQRVFVDGEVNRAGLVAITAPTTLMQAIAQAGGIKETARAGEVLVIRRDAGNRVIVVTVDLEKALNGSDMTQDILLASSDVVYVPRSAIANVNVWVDQYLRKNIPLAIGLSAPIF